MLTDRDRIVDALRLQYGIEVKDKSNGWSQNFRCIFPERHKHDDRSPSAALNPDGHYFCQACGSVQIPDLLPILGLERQNGSDWKASLSPEQRKRMARREAKKQAEDEQRAEQLRIWQLSLMAREIAEHGLPDKWRSLMLDVWKPLNVAIIEGVIRIWQQHESLPANAGELIANLHAVGMPLDRRGVYRFLEEDDLVPFLIPNADASECYMFWLDSVLNKLSTAHGMKTWSAKAHDNEGLIDGQLLEHVLGINFDTLGLRRDEEAYQDGMARCYQVDMELRVDDVGEGKSSRLRDVPITNGADYRSVFMRAHLLTHGERSKDGNGKIKGWTHVMGCASNTVNTTALDAGMELRERPKVYRQVGSVSDVFQQQPEGARIDGIKRAGVYLPFDQDMDIEDGDFAVYQPICEHVIVDDRAPAVIRAEALEQKRIQREKEQAWLDSQVDEDNMESEEVETRPGEVVWLEPDCMEEPTDGWRGFGLDPRFVYWQAVFALVQLGWSVQRPVYETVRDDRGKPRGRRLAQYGHVSYNATGEVEKNPTKDRLVDILKNHAKPLPPELSPHEVLMIDAYELGAVIEPP